MTGSSRDLRRRRRRARPGGQAAATGNDGRAARVIRAGVRWVRDVGSPRRADAGDGRERALALGLRDRWRGQPSYPYIRAAGTWLTKAGTLPGNLAIEVDDADGLLEAALAQLEDGADLVKLYSTGPVQGPLHGRLTRYAKW